MLVVHFTKDVFSRPITIIQIVDYFAYGPWNIRDVLRKFGQVKIFVRSGFNYFRRGPLDLCLDGRIYKHENGSFRLLKTEVYRSSVDGKTAKTEVMPHFPEGRFLFIVFW